MAERFKAPVLKTDDGQPSASSNLAPTANLPGRSPLQISGSELRIGNGGAVGPPKRACARREKGRPQPCRVGNRNLAPTANLPGRSPLQISGSELRIGNGGAVGPPKRACACRDKGRPQPCRVGNRNLAPTANPASIENRKSPIENPSYSLQDFEICPLVPGVSGRTN